MSFTKINSNNIAITNAVEDSLSRSGAGSDNSMSVPLDMGGNRIINSAAPVGENDLARLSDVISQATAVANQIVTNAFVNLNGLITSTINSLLPTFWLINGSYTSNISLVDVFVVPGVIMTINGCTLTITGSFYAQNLKVFNCINGGVVKFADGSVNEISPCWWGFSATASAAVNDAARQAARDSITLRGTVQYPPGAFAVSAYVPINRSYVRFLGNARFGTALVVAAGSADVTGIDGTAQPGYAGGSSPYIDQCEHRNLSVFRTDSQTATLTSGAPTGSKGFVHRYAANSIIDCLSVGSPIDYYESQTTSAEIKLQTGRGAFSGDTSSTKRFGMVSDCTIAGKAGTSANGSSIKHFKDSVQGFVGESWHVFQVGFDLRDQFWGEVDCAGATHAFVVSCLADPLGVSPKMCWDYSFLRLVLDAWTVDGLLIVGLPPGSVFNAATGYSTPGAVGSSVAPAVRINGSSGVNIGRAFEAKGGGNYALATGVRLEAGTARCTIEAKCSGLAYGVVLDASPLNVLAPVVESLASQPVAAAIDLRNGSNTNVLTGYLIDSSAGSVTTGIKTDATSQYNIIDAGVNNSTTRISVNGSSITTAGTTNHIKVTDAAIGPV